MHVRHGVLGRLCVRGLFESARCRGPISLFLMEYP